MLCPPMPLAGLEQPWVNKPPSWGLSLRGDRPVYCSQLATSSADLGPKTEDSFEGGVGLDSRCAGRRARWEGAFSLRCIWNWSSFFLSSDPGVIYSFPIVGRSGFSRAFLDLLENQGQEVPTSGREGGLWALQEGFSSLPFLPSWFCGFVRSPAPTPGSLHPWASSFPPY